MTEIVTSGSMSGSEETERWTTRRDARRKKSPHQAPPVLHATAPPARLYKSLFSTLLAGDRSGELLHGGAVGGVEAGRALAGEERGAVADIDLVEGALAGGGGDDPDLVGLLGGGAGGRDQAGAGVAAGAHAVAVPAGGLGALEELGERAGDMEPQLDAAGGGARHLDDAAVGPGGGVDEGVHPVRRAGDEPGQPFARRAREHHRLGGAQGARLPVAAAAERDLGDHRVAPRLGQRQLDAEVEHPVGGERAAGRVRGEAAVLLDGR